MSSTSTTPIAAAAVPGPDAAAPATHDSRRFWAVLVLIVLAGLGLRVAYVLAEKQGEPMMGDAIFYSGEALALAEGRGFTCPYPGTLSCPKTVPVADHPPMTAIAMAPAAWFFPRNNTASRLSMTLIGGFVILVVGLLGREVGGDRVGWLAAAGAAVYPNLWVNDALIMSETLAALTVALALLLTYKFKRRPSFALAAALGAVCGFAILTRAELGMLIPFVALPVVFLARSLATRRRFEMAGAVVVAAVIVIAPWVVPNMFRFKKPVYLSTNDGITLAGANCPSVYSGNGLGLWTLDCQFAPKGDQSEVDAYLRHKGLSYIRHHAGRLPVVIAAREGLAWGVFRPTTMVNYNKGEGREAWVSWLGYALYLVMIPFAIAGFVALRRRRVAIWPFVMQFVIVVITAAAFYGITRFRIPVEIVLVVLTAVTIDALLGRSWPRRVDQAEARAH
jgi:4-amino-4-deoxy-L-arabinose transferase-like glycosyltransferase